MLGRGKRRRDQDHGSGEPAPRPSVASLIRGDWEATDRQLAEHPEIGPQLARLRSRWAGKRRFRRIGNATDANHAAIAAVFDLAVDLARLGQPPQVARRLARVDIVMVESEDPVLTTRALPDGRCLVTVSDAFVAAVGFVLDLLRSVEDSTSIEDRHLTIAAARFFLLGQCIADRSTTVGYVGKESGRHTVATLAAVIFSLLHELGHVALGHLDAPADGTVDERDASLVEHEADQFAADTAGRVFRALPVPGLRESSALGVNAALLTVELRRLGLFIRPATLHAPYAERVDAIADRAPWMRGPTADLVALHGVVTVASDFTVQMGGGWWEALDASDAWTTHLRAAHHNTLMHQVDQVLGRPPEVNLAVLQGFDPRDDVVPTVRAAIEGRTPVLDMLQDLDVEDADWIADLDEPLSRQELLTSVASAPIWSTDVPVGRRCAAFVVMELIEPLLLGDPR